MDGFREDTPSFPVERHLAASDYTLPLLVHPVEATQCYGSSGLGLYGSLGYPGAGPAGGSRLGHVNPVEEAHK